MGVCAKDDVSRSHKPFFVQYDMLDAETADFKVILDAVFLYELAYIAALVGRNNVSVGRKMVRDYGNFFRIKHTGAKVLFSSLYRK